jgi:phosphoenolpyruvate carboxylase
MNADQIISLSTEKLYRDLNFLMTCFQEVLTELGEGDLAQALPWMSHRMDLAGESLEENVYEMQALTIAFQLLNMVEENSAAQTRRLMESHEGLDIMPGLWGRQLHKARALGYADKQIAESLPSVWVEPVLTAHPSEAKRSSVLEQHRAIYLLLVQRENGIWTPYEQEAIREQVKGALERLWRTGEIMLRRPDLAAERRGQLHYLRDVFPTIIQWLDQRLRDAWCALEFDPKLIENLANLPRISFGTWVGGDRDGHDLVTADFTADTLEQLRKAALRVHSIALRQLAKKMSLASFQQRPPDYLVKAIDEMAQALGERGKAALKRNPGEPWRQYINLLSERLPQPGPCELGLAPTDFTHPDELNEALDLLRRSLLEVKAERIVHLDLQPVQRNLQVFGFHLAVLDFRQNSAYHDRALGQLFDAAGIDAEGFDDWPDDKRVALIDRLLESPDRLTDKSAKLGPEADELLAGYKVMRNQIRVFGPAGLGALIVSMTRQTSDLLAVYLLAKEAGLLRRGNEGPVCDLPVVPLFETIEDLQSAPEILEQFLAHPITRNSRPKHQGRRLQQIMIGYSDSAKDGGILASQWGLHQAQQAIFEVGKKHGVTIRFFHGRGGTIGRGAGPTHRFLESLPPAGFSGVFRMTEQGETVAQKYANRITAVHNLELLSAGTLSILLTNEKRNYAEEDNHELIEKLAATSESAYRDLIEADRFVEFYEQATPIDALEHSRIGSRPSRRHGKRALSDLRAIPWVFSWNQSGYNLPGWYGVGTALEKLAAEDPKQFLAAARMAQKNPFLIYVLKNVETSHLTTDPAVMKNYAGLVSDPMLRDRFFEIILAEHARTKKMLEAIYGSFAAIRRPLLLHTIQRREPVLKILHARQIELLKKWRARIEENDEEGAERLLPAVLLSINAIASGLRTTG